jgi:hypothetical protein
MLSMVVFFALRLAIPSESSEERAGVSWQESPRGRSRGLYNQRAAGTDSTDLYARQIQNRPRTTVSDGGLGSSPTIGYFGS